MLRDGLSVEGSDQLDALLETEEDALTPTAQVHALDDADWLNTVAAMGGEVAG